jgi:hypothetical protein
MLLLKGCQMAMENTVKPCALALCRIWNEQLGPKLIRELEADSPKTFSLKRKKSPALFV